MGLPTTSPFHIRGQARGNPPLIPSREENGSKITLRSAKKSISNKIEWDLLPKKKLMPMFSRTLRRLKGWGPGPGGDQSSLICVCKRSQSVRNACETFASVTDLRWTPEGRHPCNCGHFWTFACPKCQQSQRRDASPS